LIALIAQEGGAAIRTPPTRSNPLKPSRRSIRFAAVSVFGIYQTLQQANGCSGRRSFLRVLAGLAAFAIGGRGSGGAALAQGNAAGFPLPDELVAATLKRLFGERKLNPADGKIKLDLPVIAEDGGNVAITVDADLPMSGAVRAQHIYIIADKNRRPMLGKFSLSSDSGKAMIATSIRLATSTEVRAIVEMSDGTLYAASKPVRVTISGCDLPPQS
jgi:sulfur-oxidizing protein SoxY